MGIIPRSPSPGRQLRNDETTVPNDAVQKEVQDLRVSPAPELSSSVQYRELTQINLQARLALLERGLDVKPESSSNAARKLKREREDDEGSERPSHRVKVEHVDLTDDRQRRRSSVKVEHVDLTAD